MSPPDETTKAIFRASMDGDAKTVIALIGNSTSRLHTDTPFGTPLHMAASRGDLVLTKTLVALGADINRRGGSFGGGPINVAAGEGRLEVVRFLIEQGAELDTTEPERNPLFSAIYGGHIDIVKLLLAAGLDASIRYTGQYMTNMGALEFAIERGQHEIVGILQAQASKAQPNNPADA
jgi:uncharacterized protein